MQTGLIADKRAAPTRRRAEGRVQPLAIAAGVFLVMAVSSVAYALVRADVVGWSVMLAILAVAGLVLIGLGVMRAGRRPQDSDGGQPLVALVDALQEPAAVAAPDGRLLETNDAWREAVGEAPRLSRRGGEGPELYAALAAARRTGAGEAPRGVAPERGDGVYAAHVSRMGTDRLLVRLTRAEAARPDAPAAFLSAAPAAPEAVAQAAPATLDALATAAPFGAALLDGPDPFDAAVVDGNAALGALTQGRARPGVRFGDLLDPQGLAEAQARLKLSGGPVEVRLAGEADGGARGDGAAKGDVGRTAHLYVSRVGAAAAVYLLDVTEQKQLELQLAQSQKMQAIGQLAGGVAHDFNNLLTAIQLRLDELLHRHPVGDPSYEGLNEIRQTGVRAADLVRKLLAFSRKQTVQRETLDLGELISEFDVLLRRLLREDVRLVNDYGRDLPLVRADRSQLETAVINLSVNARDALRSHGSADGGPAVVRIRAARLARAEAVALGYPGAPEAGCALIEVADNGPGIQPDVAEKIFEPFFTTKPVGEGTGLGLATVYGIVKQADGWIHMESAPGQGAAFRIFLPIHTPAAGESAPQPRTPLKFKPTARDLSGAGRILFVEDEDAVRGVAARLLRARGYEVIEAADGEEALELAQMHAGTIDLLISDVVMPGMDGPTLLKKARPYLEDAQVMFISGYAEAEFSDLLEGEEGLTFLAKPIDIKVLAERVKQQLQGG